MSGTQVGALKTSAKNKKRFGEDFYKKIGAKGGKAKVPKGFAIRRDIAVIAGQKGGKAKVKSKKQGAN